MIYRCPDCGLTVSAQSGEVWHPCKKHGGKNRPVPIAPKEDT